MDDLAERVPLYGAYFVSENATDPLKIIDMEPLRLANCDGLVNQTGCYGLVCRFPIFQSSAFTLFGMLPGFSE